MKLVILSLLFALGSLAAAQDAATESGEHHAGGGPARRPV